MTETLTGPDGKVINLDAHEREFARAMAAPTPDEPQAPAPPKIPPEAPWGYKSDGEPRKRPPGPGRPSKPRTKPGPSDDTKKAAESAQDVSQRRTDGVAGLFQVGAAGCLAISLRGGDAWKADAITLAGSAEGMGQACAAIAAEDQRFARVLDKITAAGPYAALFTVAVPMIAQLARNHGVRAMEALQAVPPEVLIAQLDESPDAGSDTPAG